MAESLSLTITIDKASYDKGETVAITGFIRDSEGIGVPYATVSIEVTDPNDNQVHIAMTLSESDGSYRDDFKVATNLPEGTYTIYVTASKTGYTDINLTTTYTVIPEFGYSSFSLLLLAISFLIILLFKNSTISISKLFSPSM